MDHQTERMLTLRTKSFADQIHRRATTMRQVADELDRIACRAATVGTPEYNGAKMNGNLAWQAHDVQHAVLTMLGNLSLEALTTSAYDTDSMREASE